MYIVEGNIGVGKSTFLNLINQNIPEIQIQAEPLENWATQIYGQNLLENFYKDPKRWAYTIETLAMICRSRDHIIEQKSGKNSVMERSIYSGHYCFAMNGYQSGFFTQMEWQAYNIWVNFLLHQQCLPPKGFIYLKADPCVCFERIKKRNRSSESTISLEYLNQIDYWHDKFLIQKDGLAENLKNIPVLILDCNQDFVENLENQKNHLKSLKNFISIAE